MKDKRNNLGRTWMMLILAVLLLAAPSLSAQAADSQPLKTVRVGCLIYPGYQEGEGDAPKSGCGYEYLQQIACYAGGNACYAPTGVERRAHSAQG